MNIHLHLYPESFKIHLIKSHKSCQAIDLAGKTLPRVKEVCVNNVKHTTKHVFVIEVVHSEEVPLFFQLKYTVRNVCKLHSI